MAHWSVIEIRIATETCKVTHCIIRKRQRLYQRHHFPFSNQGYSWVWLRMHLEIAFANSIKSFHEIEIAVSPMPTNGTQIHHLGSKFSRANPRQKLILIISSWMEHLHDEGNRVEKVSPPTHKHLCMPVWSCENLSRKRRVLNKLALRFCEENRFSTIPLSIFSKSSKREEKLAFRNISFWLIHIYDACQSGWFTHRSCDLASLLKSSPLSTMPLLNGTSTLSIMQMKPKGSLHTDTLMYSAGFSGRW